MPTLSGTLGLSLGGVHDFTHSLYTEQMGILVILSHHMNRPNVTKRYLEAIGMHNLIC